MSPDREGSLWDTSGLAVYGMSSSGSARISCNTYAIGCATEREAKKRTPQLAENLEVEAVVAIAEMHDQDKASWKKSGASKVSRCGLWNSSNGHVPELGMT